MWAPHHSPDLNLPHLPNQTVHKPHYWDFSLSLCVSSKKLQPELSSVSLDFPCHIAPPPCAWLYILKTKLILSGHDLDSCPCSLFWYNCPIIYPSPCSGLAVSFLPCGGMTFHLSWMSMSHYLFFKTYIWLISQSLFIYLLTKCSWFNKPVILPICFIQTDSYIIKTEGVFGFKGSEICCGLSFFDDYIFHFFFFSVRELVQIFCSGVVCGTYL